MLTLHNAYSLGLMAQWNLIPTMLLLIALLFAINLQLDGMILKSPINELCNQLMMQYLQFDTSDMVAFIIHLYYFLLI